MTNNHNLRKEMKSEVQNQEIFVLWLSPLMRQSPLRVTEERKLHQMQKEREREKNKREVKMENARLNRRKPDKLKVYMAGCIMDRI